MIQTYNTKKFTLLIAGDIVLISVAYILSPLIRFGVLQFGNVQPILGWGVILGIYLLAYYLGDLYESDMDFWTVRYLFQFGVTVAVSAAASAIVLYMIPSIWFGRGILGIFILLAALSTYSWRLFNDWIFRAVLLVPKRVLIVGAGWAGKTIYEVIRTDPSIKVVGFVDDDTTKHGEMKNPPVLGDCSILDKMIKAHQVDSVIMAISHLNNSELIKCVLDSKMEGVEICDMPYFYEQRTGKIPVEHINDLWFMNTPVMGVRRNIYNRKGKRLLDVLCSCLGLIGTLPLGLLVAVWIKLDSEGPVFYRQQRVRSNEVPFDLIKFRSMRVDAETNGAVWARKGDDRITRIGKIIRKLRIDEIPQMVNVLKGEMSFIGPRPERPEFVKILEKKIPYYSLRHAVKPGITGWAQINYPYGASEDDAMEKVQHDLFYIKNLSLLLDIHILLKTIKVVFRGTGAR